ncbi:MAG: hypothetical protein A2030_08490 [Chloroflexi bacterium RBG_19FT_COMBO_50_10]|nr:MAG: hypothetical protein A2030_08490 [Chloroflexi bacterium RBG_19FT_COMBO_50_10]
MQVEFNPNQGRFSFNDLGVPGVSILDGIAWVSYRTLRGRLQRSYLAAKDCSTEEHELVDVHGMGRQIVVHCPASPDGIELTYRINTYAQHCLTLLQLSVRNLSHAPIFLQEFCLIQAVPGVGGHLHIANSNEQLRFFKVGWQGWDYSGLRTPVDRNTNTWLDFLTSTAYKNTLTPIIRPRGEFWSEGWGVIAGTDAAAVAGFVTTAHQFGQVYTCLRKGEEAISLHTQADGVLVDPGESRESEWGYLQFVQLPTPEPSADYVAAVARQMHARVPASPPPPMWTHWYHFYHDITEELFLQNLEVLADRRSIVPYQVVELDDGYQSAWGDWSSTNDRFPHGLEWLADKITAKGFTPGLWLAPFAVQAKSSIARRHPDWLVKNKRGRPINAGFLYNIFIQALDTSHPAVLEHLRNLMDQISHQWGFGMVKVDFVNAGALPGVRYNPKLTRAEALRGGLEAIRQGAGEQTFLLGSGCPFGPAIGVVDAMRIGPDTAPSWEPYFHWLKWVGPLIKKEPSLPSLRNAIRHTINLSALHQRWWWNDPDCLLVRDTNTRLTEPEVQSAVSLVGLSGGMLVSSDDLRKVSEARLGWLSLLVPNLALRGMALDWLDRHMPALYQVKLQSDGQAWQDVALFNWEDESADCILQVEKLGFKPGTSLQVFDFWAKKYQHLTAPEMVFEDVPPHGCKLLRVCEVGSTPQLVGDTLHISQGAEISFWQASAGELVIETVDMGRRVVGELWLTLADSPKNVTCNADQVVVQDIGQGIYALHLQFNGKAKVVVTF